MSSLEQTAGLSTEAYWVRIKEMGLVQHSSQVYRHSLTGAFHYVESPAEYTAEQRSEIVERLEKCIGCGFERVRIN
jgi:hypothetical protein